MKLFSTLPAFILVAIIAGCGSSSSNESTTPETTPVSTQPATTITDTFSKQPAAGIQVSAPVVPTTNPPVAGKAGLNPAHGQPGHRCEIAVGAPLDSKPNQPVITNNQQPVVTKNTQAITIPYNTQPANGQTNPIVINPGNMGVSAAGLNPEHGKPGHRCDIAVGAPLNSKPTTTQPVINTNPQPTVKQTSPTLTSPPVIPNATAAGLNPEHGKPGHRCDIAVGAPLDSKPKQ
ncbi:MAG: hypothetical protein WBC06_05270 [Chitinophagaceae bacterium]